ncbi:DUF3099 domain-containing protein [Paractinoplanes atraurantiacus]
MLVTAVQPSKQPVLITNAARSQQELLRARHKRYLLMMSVRAGLLVVGTVVVSAYPSRMWAWCCSPAGGVIYRVGSTRPHS